MKAFTYFGLLIIALVPIILSIQTFYYSNNVDPLLFIAVTFIVLVFCIIKAIEEVTKNNSK